MSRTDYYISGLESMKDPRERHLPPIRGADFDGRQRSHLGGDGYSLNKESRTTANGLLVMAISGIVATIGLPTGALHLVTG